MTTLGITDSTAKSVENLPEKFTCENCEFTSLQSFTDCPKCFGIEEIETKEEIIGEGKGLIIFGTFYAIISLIVILNSGGNIDFFSKASDDDFLSVSHFAALFAFPLILISTGIITFLRKKDSWKGRLIIGGIIAVIVFTFDQILMRIL